MKKTIHSKEEKFLIAQLKKARKETGHTQVAVSKTLEVSQSYISKVENGDLMLDVIQLKRFADLYKKDLEYTNSI